MNGFEYRIAWYTLNSRVDHRGCLVWLNELDRNGYPSGQVYRRTYRMFYGEIPKGLELDHICRNRACINPLHLDAVTRSENMLRSMQARPGARRGPYAVGPASFCMRGHDLTGPNLYVSPGGQRHCRACSKMRTDDRYTRLTGRAPEQRRKWVRKT